MSHLKIPVGEDDHIQGVSTAPCTLVEYGDYQCPFCGAAYPVIKRLQQNFGDKLRFVFRNFPLTQIHPFAELAAETAEFASKHGKFWNTHDLIYENQDELGEELLFKIAERLGLPQDASPTHCVSKHTMLEYGGIFPAAFAAESMARPVCFLTTNCFLTTATTKPWRKPSKTRSVAEHESNFPP